MVAKKTNTPDFRRGVHRLAVGVFLRDVDGKIAGIPHSWPNTDVLSLIIFFLECLLKG